MYICIDMYRYENYSLTEDEPKVSYSLMSILSRGIPSRPLDRQNLTEYHLEFTNVVDSYTFLSLFLLRVHMR